MAYGLSAENGEWDKRVSTCAGRKRCEGKIMMMIVRGHVRQLNATAFTSTHYKEGLGDFVIVLQGWCNETAPIS